jgi:hypothetical protein
VVCPRVDLPNLDLRFRMASFTIRLNAAPVSGCVEFSPLFAAVRIAF